MEKIMKTRRLKPFLFVIALYLIPIGMVSTALTTPVFANETSLSEEHVSNTPATIPQDAEEGKTWEETHNHGSNDKNTTIRFKLGEDEETSEEHVFISIDGVDKDITAISTIFNKLIETEWDDLDDAEKEEILETLKEIEAGIEVEVDVDSSGPSATEAIIAIVAIMFTIGSPILIIGTILYYKHRKRRQRNALIEKFLDSGQEVPAELMESGDLADNSSNTLSRGIKLTAIGLGLFIFLGSMIDWDIATVALIPLCIGIARIVIWKLSDKTSSSTE
jgi:hypothetical protein|tara:strand:+ start:5633 stop:6463 length:831 start_codon:yes stop_codon:yes gene_type:complete